MSVAAGSDGQPVMKDETMPFGINVPNASNSERTESGAFLGRLQHDSTSGVWKYVKRVQQSDGGFADEESEPFNRPSFLLDAATFEFGWIKFRSPPDFQVVPYGQTPPERPAEMWKNDQGREVPAYRVGFRCKVYNPKLFGDADPYYFANNADAVNGPVDELITEILASAQFAVGKVPLVAVTGRTKNEPKSKVMKATWSPVFEIKGWHDRPACFGERTVGITRGRDGLPRSAAPTELNKSADRAAATGGGIDYAKASRDAGQTNGGIPDDGMGEWDPAAPTAKPNVGRAERDSLNDEIPF